jgi:SAM-dependent methyltransferase
MPHSDWIEFVCPSCQGPLDISEADGASCRCGFRAARTGGVLDLLGGGRDGTADHYSLQWGPDIDFSGFMRSNQEASALTPGQQLGWPDLFARVRSDAARSETCVLDAACGFGGVLDALGADPAPPGLRYLGFDIHEVLHEIRPPTGLAPHQVALIRWDMSSPVPVDTTFDVVICRAALHHSPDPRRSFASLAAALRPGGTLAISVYAKKARPREALDTALREEITRMPARDAFGLAREFTLLGRDLQTSAGWIEIIEDLPFLGIKRGRYRIQEFIYDYFLKCWYNPAFGERYSDVVNFDWYHPPYAYRFAREEVASWFEEEGIDVARADSIKAQHYIEGVKRAK